MLSTVSLETYILGRLIDLLACRENMKVKGEYQYVCLSFPKITIFPLLWKTKELKFSFFQSSSLSYIHIKHIGMLTHIQKRTGNKLLILPSCLHIAKRMAHFACVGCRNLSERTLESRPRFCSSLITFKWNISLESLNQLHSVHFFVISYTFKFCIITYYNYGFPIGRVYWFEMHLEDLLSLVQNRRHFSEVWKSTFENETKVISLKLKAFITELIS